MVNEDLKNINVESLMHCQASQEILHFLFLVLQNSRSFIDWKIDID